jgi:hypothetical protein
MAEVAEKYVREVIDQKAIVEFWWLVGNVMPPTQPFTLIVTTWGIRYGILGWKSSIPGVDEIVGSIRPLLAKWKGEPFDPNVMARLGSDRLMQKCSALLKDRLGMGTAWVLLVGFRGSSFASNMGREAAQALLEDIFIPGLLKDREEGKLR